MRKLIYIMGCAHCGSTLLTTLLGRHSQIATVGELKMTAIPDVNDYLCGCGEQLLECEFWKKVGAVCRDEGGDLDLRDFQTHFRGAGWLTGRLVRTGVRGKVLETLRSAGLKTWSPARNRLDAIVERNRRIIDTVCHVEGKPVFLDGSKDPTRLLHFARSGVFDVKAIHLVRDGRAILASHLKREPDVQANLKAWRTKALECERVKALLPKNQLMTLRHEDLCGDPLAMLGRIFSFVGLDDESARCLAEGTEGSRHIIGHNSRLGGHRAIKLSKDWERSLPASAIARFEAMDPGLNRLYSYPGPAES